MSSSELRSCGLQVLYNIRPQAVTAADLEGTAYDAGLRSSKPASHPKMRQSTHVVRQHWPLLLGLLASAAFLLLQRHRRALMV